MIVALKQSIAHWKRLRDGKPVGRESPQGEHCALCARFYSWTSSCDRCPVKIRTGFDLCKGTPWQAANAAWYNDRWQNQFSREIYGRKLNQQTKANHMHKVTIEGVLNGWKVKAGCQEVVFADADVLCCELRKYLTNPAETIQRYLTDSVNAKWIKNEAMPPAAEAPCDGQRILSEPGSLINRRDPEVARR